MHNVPQARWEINKNTGILYAQRLPRSLPKSSSARGVSIAFPPLALTAPPDLCHRRLESPVPALRRGQAREQNRAGKAERQWLVYDEYLITLKDVETSDGSHLDIPAK